MNITVQDILKKIPNMIEIEIQKDDQIIYSGESIKLHGETINQEIKFMYARGNAIVIEV